MGAVAEFRHFSGVLQVFDGDNLGHKITSFLWNYYTIIVADKMDTPLAGGLMALRAEGS